MAATTIGSFLVRLAFDGTEFDEGTEDAEKRLQGFGGSLSKMGALLDGAVVAGLKAATAAMAAFGAVTVKVGADFEQAITTVAAVSGATSEELQALTDQARSLGASTAFSATEAATGMQDLARAGLSTAEIIAASESALLLAGASASSMSEATGILASTLSQFQLDASESGRIADVFSTAMNNSQLSMDSLREAMKFAGVTGQQFGMSLEETTAAVAQFRNLGLEGSLAGNAFKMSMLQATKPTEKKAAVLRELGLTFADINPETRSFAEIMRTVGEAQITASQAAEVFGARAGVAVAGVAEQFATGASTFDDLLTKLESSGGSVEQTYARMTDTVSGQTAIVRSAFEELSLSVFDTFGGGLKDLLTEIASTIQFVAAEFAGSSQGLAQTFDQNIRAAIEYLRANRMVLAESFKSFAAALSEIVIVLGRIAPLLDDIGKLILVVFVANKVRVFVAALVSLAGTLQGIVVGTGGVRVALKLLYAELVVMSGGTLALVAAIGALVVGLVSLVSSSNDAADAADRLREAQEAQEAVEAGQHRARMERAGELQSATSAVSLALVRRLAEEDRLTDALERRLGALSNLTDEQIASGIESGKLFEATIDGEQIVLDYAAALDLAALGGDEAAAAQEALAGAFVSAGSRVVEAEARVSELLSVQEEYNRLVAEGRDGVRGTSYAFGQLASSVEDYRVKLDAARAEVERAKGVQADLGQTANRLATEAEVQARKNEKRARAAANAAKREADANRDLADALEKATEARVKFEEALAAKTAALSDSQAEVALAALRKRLAEAQRVFAAEIDAAREAGRSVEEIERRRDAAVAQIRAQEAAALGAAVTERIDGLRDGLRREQDLLRQSQADRRDEFLQASAAEIAIAEATGQGVEEARARQTDGLRVLRNLESSENAAFEEARVAEAERTARAIEGLLSEEVEARQSAGLRVLGFQTQIGARRVARERAIAEERARVNDRFDDFLRSNANLTADQIVEIEGGRAEALSAIDEGVAKDRKRRLAEGLAAVGRAAAKTVAVAARVTADVAKKAAAGLSKIFGAFTGGLNLQALSGSIDDILATVEESGGKVSLADAAVEFVDGLVDNAVRFVEALVVAAPLIAERLGELLPDLIRQVAEAIPAVVQAVAQNLGPILDAIVEGIPLLLQGIVDSVPAIVDAVVAFLEEGLPQLLSALAPLVADLIQTLVEAMPRVVEAAMAALPDLISLITDAVTKLVSAVPDLVGVIVDAVPSILVSLFDSVDQIIVAVMDAIPLILNELIAGLPGIVGSLVEGILGAVVTVIEQLPALLDSVLTEVLPSLVENLILMVAQIVSAVLEALPQIVNGIVMLIPALITSLIEMIPLLIEAVIRALPQLLSAVIVGVLSAIPQIVVALIAAIPAIIVALVEGLFVEIIAKLPFLVVELIAALIRGIVDGISEFVDVFKRIFQEALGFVGDLFGKDESGDGLVKRTGKAIADGAKKAWSAVTGVFNDTPGVMKVGRSPATAMFAPGDLFVAAKDPLDLARMALSEVGSAVGARASTGGSRPAPPPMPSQRSSGGSAPPIDIAVIAEGRVLDAVQVTALDRGHAPRMQSKLRKAAGVKVGLDRGRRNPYSS